MEKNNFLKRKIVVIGGGTGTYVVLLGLKDYFENLVAVVTMADSGGSAKKERDEWGLLPVSDIRKALLALAGTSNHQEELFRKLFSYRFSEGVGIEGVTFGNLLLVALSNILNSQEKAIEEARHLLHIEGEVYPVTYSQTNLILEYADGNVVVGEHFLEVEEFPGDGTQRVVNFYLLPPVSANPSAITALKSADLIIFPPGDLYGSLLANLVVEGIKEAIKESRAKKLYIVNLMTKYGQTHGFSARDHIQEIEKYLGSPLDHILINSAPLPKQLLVAYAREKDFPVDDDLKGDLRVIRDDFLIEGGIKKQKGDKLKRSLIRHDSDKLANAILTLFTS